MGQSYCAGLCGHKEEIESGLILQSCSGSDQPTPEFAKRVKLQIELQPKTKETYMLNRTAHPSDKKGVLLELYYIYDYAAYYEGEWKGGLPHGQGRIIYDDGSLYEGCFKEGIADCHKALYIRADGSYYRGEIKNNKANGYGELTTSKLFYKGMWLNDLPHGKARQIYSSISFYEGVFQYGVKEGMGVYQWNHQQYYMGQFSKNKMEGQGTIKMKDYLYKGTFADGVKDGFGVMEHLIDKWVYTGQFSHNQMTGQGQMLFSDGVLFKGLFAHNERVKGTLFFNNGETLNIDSELLQQGLSNREK